MPLRNVCRQLCRWSVTNLMYLFRSSLRIRPIRPEEEKSFSFAEESEEDVVINPVNVVARAVFMPYVSVYTLVSGKVLNALFFLFSLPLPAACAAGYLMGPKMRDKKLHDIAKGKKRKMRNLKVNKKPRTPKAEV